MEKFQVQTLKLEGLKLISLKSFPDERGFFVERFQISDFESLGLPTRFAQINHSHSLPRVLRGLHYQVEPTQGKLVGVIRGRVWDVAVDLRPGSPTFGQSHGVELSASNGLLFWIPAGFAHGFCVLGEEPADLLYQVDEPYSPAGEKGIVWNDPALNIQWPIQDPILSSRDRALPSFN